MWKISETGVKSPQNREAAAQISPKKKEMFSFFKLCGGKETQLFMLFKDFCKRFINRISLPRI